LGTYSNGIAADGKWTGVDLLGLGLSDQKIGHAVRVREPGGRSAGAGGVMATFEQLFPEIEIEMEMGGRVCRSKCWTHGLVYIGEYIRTAARCRRVAFGSSYSIL
jgi:hypothetical protein